MGIVSSRSRVLVTTSLLAAWTVLGFACTVEDENPATTRQRGTDSGTDGASGSSDDDSGPTGAPLCAAYGGIEGVESIADAIRTAAMKDCRISPVLNRRDALTDHSVYCFRLFVGGNFQCPGVSFSVNVTKDPKGATCKSRYPGVDFTDADFNAFGEATRTALKEKGLTDDDVRALAPAFEGARQDLVNGNIQDQKKYSQCAPNCQIGGQACVRPILDAGNDTGPQDSGQTDTGAADTGAGDADSGG